MEKQVIADVQSSWKLVGETAPQAAALFYANLFEIDPALRPLFKGDLQTQGNKLAQTIGVAVDKLTDLDALVPVLQALGKRHVAYGVQEAHYQTVGTALLKTLEQGLGQAFTPQVKQSWTEVYGLISSVMIAAAKA